MGFRHLFIFSGRATPTRSPGAVRNSSKQQMHQQHIHHPSAARDAPCSGGPSASTAPPFQPRLSLWTRINWQASTGSLFAIFPLDAVHRQLPKSTTHLSAIALRLTVFSIATSGFCGRSNRDFRFVPTARDCPLLRPRNQAISPFLCGNRTLDSMVLSWTPPFLASPPKSEPEPGAWAHTSSRIAFPHTSSR